MVGDLPFRNIQRNAWFLLNVKQAGRVLDLCNRPNKK